MKTGRPTVKMPPAQRAKQFLPFDALPGLREALQKKEAAQERFEMPNYAEEERREMDQRLAAMQPGDLVALAYLRGGTRVFLQGNFGGINRRRRVLLLDDQEVPIDRIIALADGSWSSCDKPDHPSHPRQTSREA